MTSGAWSDGPSPLRASRSTQTSSARSASDCADQREVDAHAAALLEAEHPHLPEGVGRPPVGGVGRGTRQQVDQGGLVGAGGAPEIGDGRPLLGRDVGVAVERRDVPDVLVGRRHVEIAEQSVRSVQAELGPFGGALLGQGPQEAQLVPEVLAAHRAAVRHVDRPEPDTGAGCPDGTGLGGPLEAGFRGQPTGDLAEPYPGEDGHPVPPAGAVMDRLVACVGQRRARPGLVGRLGLLGKQHIG